jgi:hypothetical protein
MVVGIQVVSSGRRLVILAIRSNPDIRSPDIRSPDIRSPDIRSPDTRSSRSSSSRTNRGRRIVRAGAGFLDTDRRLVTGNAIAPTAKTTDLTPGLSFVIIAGALVVAV